MTNTNLLNLGNPFKTSEVGIYIDDGTEKWLEAARCRDECPAVSTWAQCSQLCADVESRQRKWSKTAKHDIKESYAKCMASSKVGGTCGCARPSVFCRDQSLVGVTLFKDKDYASCMVPCARLQNDKGIEAARSCIKKCEFK